MSEIFEAMGIDPGIIIIILMVTTVGLIIVVMNLFSIVKKTDQNRSLIKYGIVKYDAFDDVGGKLSFALAMLDQTDTGFVLNAIHSKENCFLYIKEVMNGESYIILSDEEIQALRIARKYGDDADV